MKKIDKIFGIILMLTLLAGMANAEMLSSPIPWKFIVQQTLPAQCSSNYAIVGINGTNHTTTCEYKGIWDSVFNLNLGEKNITNTTSIFTKSVPYINPMAYGATGNGATDDTAAFTAAVQFAVNQGGGHIKIPCGTYNLTSALYFNMTASVQNVIFEGSGLCTVIKPQLTGVDGTDFVFYVNEHPSGTRSYDYPNRPRVLFDNMYINGANTANVSFIKTNQVGVMMRNVKVSYYYRGLSTTDGVYNDGNIVDHVVATRPRQGGVFYYQNGNGDGLDFRSVSAEGAAMYADRVHGGHIYDGIGGGYVIKRSQNMVLEEMHFETGGYQSWDNVTSVTFRDCDNCVIRNSYFGNRNSNKNPAMIEIDNQNTLYESGKVYIQNNNFAMMCDDENCTRLPDVNIINMSTSDEVYFENNYGYFNIVGLTGFEPHGFKIQSTGVSALQTILAANQHMFTGQAVNIKYDPQDGWRVAKTEMEDVKIYPKMSDPSISSVSQQSSGSYEGIIASGTNYFYVVSSLDRGYQTNTSAAVNRTATADNVAFEINVNARNVPSILRIWRGNTSTTFQSYIDMPVNEYSIRLYDQGYSVGGYTWVSTSVPAISTKSNSTVLMKFDNKNIITANYNSFLKTGSYYFGSMSADSTSVTATASTSLTAYPFVYGTNAFMDRVGFYVAVVNATTACSVAIYNDTGDIFPSTKLFAHENQALESTGFKYSNISETLLKKDTLYWAAYQCNQTGGAERLAAILIRGIIPVLGADITGSSQYTVYRNASTWAAGVLPTTFPTAATLVSNNNPTAVYTRVSGKSE
jgi:hypothetical protein